MLKFSVDVKYDFFTFFKAIKIPSVLLKLDYQKELKEKVLETSTNFHILSEVLEQVGLDNEAKTIVSKIKEVLL